MYYESVKGIVAGNDSLQGRFVKVAMLDLEGGNWIEL